MVDQTTGTVPRIRFKAYSEPWAEEKIGDVLAEKRRPIVLEDDQRYELITVKRRNEGVVSRGHLLGREILVKNYAELKAGDFVISKRQVVHGATGIVPPALDGAIVSNEYLTAVDGEKLLTEFLTIVASLPAMRRKFFLSSYGVDIEKLFFDVDDWRQRPIIIPCVAEQRRISAFVQKMDELILLAQRKHEKLFTLKASMLQKMFPHAGGRTPEIRFKGFTGDWKKKRLYEISSLITKGTTPLGKRGGGTVAFVKIESIDKLTGDIAVNSRVSEEEHAGYLKRSQLKEGDILFSIAGTLGRVAIVQKKILPANTNQAIAIVRLKEGVIDYLTTYLKGKAVVDFVTKNPTIGAQPNLSLEQVRKLEILLPHEDEQKAIGGYFRTLDSLLAKSAAQIQKLRQVKLAFTEETFA